MDRLSRSAPSLRSTGARFGAANPACKRRSRGLTLIEIVIALAVVAILVTLAAPSFGSRLTQHRLRAAAEGLALDLGEARFQAGNSGRSIYVTFDARADWCYAVATQAHCPCDADSACLLKAVRARDLPGIVLAQASDAEFDPGQLGASGRSGGGAEWLGGDGQRLRVAVSPLGRATVCTLNKASGYPSC